MAKICSFCKREVTNGVCCDYCGTPLIFSEDDGAPKDKAENKAEQKSEALYKNSGDNVNFSADTEGEEIARREIKSGIEALYEQSRHLRENKDDSIFGAEKSNAESIVKMAQIPQATAIPTIWERLKLTFTIPNLRTVTFPRTAKRELSARRILR